MGRFALMCLLMARLSSSSLASVPSDRVFRGMGLDDDHLGHQPILPQREHGLHAPPMSLAWTPRGGLWRNTAGACLPTGAPCPSWSAFAGAPERTRADLGAMIASASAAKAEAVSLSGWFTVIWNDKTRYVLTDNQGQWTELLLDEETAKPFGGPLTLNRKRVTIVGEKVTAPPGAVRVLSIALE